MPEQLSDVTDVGAAFKHEGRRRVPEQVAAAGLAHPGGLQGRAGTRHDPRKHPCRPGVGRRTRCRPGALSAEASGEQFVGTLAT